MRARLGRLAAVPLVGLLLGLLLAGCGSGGASSGADASPPPAICAGLKVGIPAALPCDAVATLALDVLRERAPDQLARGITEVVVELALCPAGEMPPQVDCSGVTYAQLVRVSFGPAPVDGPIEPYLVVALEPVSGRLLGIINPLVR